MIILVGPGSFFVFQPIEEKPRLPVTGNFVEGTRPSLSGPEMDHGYHSKMMLLEACELSSPEKSHSKRPR
jgi:hypothetical protein